ncbi:MAG: hypothetical protein A3H96_11385 [Acidobacteria bacterium RIFCSPLOWO2_02_FULL_67_36]|nr:MAG: hypothetical protein A3H96_11385 [Acidobacteria bacterium RIFCSPLOWO2_02_FULL_67_36]OGA76304.1 MAG: hypothetical protein A3G27_05830 [Betaproteobacteria bacterium RIFCSPLOWO2_12_FULL_66_14]
MIERDHRAVFTEQLRHRRRGRPRSATPKITTSVKLPEDVYDAFCRRALVERQSVHALLNEAIASYVAAHRLA